MDNKKIDEILRIASEPDVEITQSEIDCVREAFENPDIITEGEAERYSHMDGEKFFETVAAVKKVKKEL